MTEFGLRLRKVLSFTALARLLF